MTTSEQVFQDGGKLRENALYIERGADALLYEYLLEGEYCSILDPRQVGKSSLMERTSKRLTEAGVKCGFVDLQSFANADITFDKLIFSLVFTISRSLGIKIDNIAFLKKYESLSANKVLEQFFREVVFPSIDSKIVLFIDEVDIVKSFRDLPEMSGGSKTLSDNVITDKSSIGDSFFLTFRSLHESRTSAPFDRLAVCFAGVAFPADLVNRPEISPFNVGKRITLSDFTFEEMQKFRQALPQVNTAPDETIKEVFKWTDGHPYMSQKIFADLTKIGFDGANATEKIAERVDQLFLLPNISPDANLAYAVKRLTSINESEAAKKRRPQILETFLRIKKSEGEKIPLERHLIDNETPSFDESRLFGLTKIIHEPDGNYLKVRNLIYDKFFSEEWLTKQLNDQREFRPFFERWTRYGKIDDYLLRGSALDAAVEWSAGREDITLEEREFIDRSKKFNQDQLLIASEARRARTFRIAAVLTSLLALLAISLFGYSGYLYTVAKDKQLYAEGQSNIAINKQQEAQEQRDLAQQRKEIADNRSEEAMTQRKIAEEKTLEAEQQTKLAEKERLEAQRQKEIAENERNEAQRQEKLAVEEKSKAQEAQRKAQISENEAQISRIRAVEAEKRTSLTSRLVLRQERATESKYNDEQQAAFRKDAENIANQLTSLGSNTNNDLSSVLPRSITDIKSKETPAERIPSGRFESYAGELMRNGKIRNYFAEIGYLDTNAPANETYLSFRTPDNDAAERIFKLPPIMASDDYYSRTSRITFVGDRLFINGYYKPIFFDRQKRQLTSIDWANFNNTYRRRIISEVFQSRKNKTRLAFIQAPYFEETPSLLLYADNLGIYDAISGDFFIKITDEDILFSSENNLQTVNIITGEKTDLGLKISSEIEAAEKYYFPIFNEKSRNLGILKLYTTSGQQETMNAVLYVFDLTKKKNVVSGYKLSEKDFIPEAARYSVILRNFLENIIEFSADGDYLFHKVIAEVGESSRIGLAALDISDYKPGKKAKLIKSNGIINKLFFLPDGKRVAILESFEDADKKEKNCLNIYNWKDLRDDSDQRETTSIPPCQFESQPNFQFSSETPGAFFAADNKSYFLVGAEDGSVKAIDLDDRSIVFNEKISPSAITGIKVEERDLSISSQRNVYSQITYENKMFRVKENFDLKDYTINSPINIKFSPESGYAADFSGKTVRVWDEKGNLPQPLTLNDDIKAVEFFPDGKKMLVMSNREAKFWDPGANKQIDISKPFLDQLTVDKKALTLITSISVSSSGKYGVVELKNGYVLYDVEKNVSFPSAPFWEDAAAGNPDNKYTSSLLGSDSYRAWGISKYPLGSPTRFSQDDKFIIVVNEANKNEQLVSEVFKNEIDNYLNVINVKRNIVRIIDVQSRSILKEFFIDNFKYAKFSANGAMVAFFTTNGQCFIAQTGKDESDQALRYKSDQALLIPLENVTFGSFSKNGDRFITVVNVSSVRNKVVHIFDTQTGKLVHKANLPLPDMKGTEKPLSLDQEVYYAKFSDEDENEIEIGRMISYTVPRKMSEKSTTQTANTNSNTNSRTTSTATVYNANVPNTSSFTVSSSVKSRLSTKVESEKYTYDCYRIRDDGMLVAESRCGIPDNKK